jgi:hypothetical protein
LRDLEMIAAIAHRANRHVNRDPAEFDRMDGEQSEQVRHQLVLAWQQDPA